MPTRTASLAALVCLAGASTALAADAPSDPLEYGLCAAGNVDLEKDSAFINFSIYGRNGVSGKKNSVYAGWTRVASMDAGDVTGVPGHCVGAADLEPMYAMQADAIVDAIEAGSLLPGNVTNVVVTASLPATLASGTAYVVNGDVSVSKNLLAEDVVIAVRGDFQWAKDGGFLNTAGAGGYANAVVCTGTMSFKKDAMVTGAMLVSGGDFTIDKDAAGVGAHIQVGGNAHIKKDAFTALGSYQLLDLSPARAITTPTAAGLFD